jgi:hypothetical protein
MLHGDDDDDDDLGMELPMSSLMSLVSNKL